MLGAWLLDYFQISLGLTGILNDILTAGIGAGMGIGNVLGQALSGVGAPQQGAPKAAASAGASDVMTPSEAAAYLRVSEEDEREGLDTTAHGETAYHL